MSSHEQSFLEQLDQKLKKQYNKYFISAVVFILILGISQYSTLRLAFADHEFRIKTLEEKTSTHTAEIKNLGIECSTIRLDVANKCK